MAHVVILDLGHGLIKVGTLTGKELTIPHALFELTDARYSDIVKRARGGQGDDYARIAGIPYVTGASALSAGVIHKRERADRYAREYYGVLAAQTIARLIGGGDVILFAAHPPGDANYTDELANSILGKWHVEMNGRETDVNVVECFTFDEPLGGLSNVMLTQQGKLYDRPRGYGRQLVIDIGNTTTDIAACNEAGEIDYMVTDTVQAGIGDIVRDFAAEFKGQYKDLTRSTRDLPEQRVREAIVSGRFEGGGKSIDCADIVQDVTYKLLNELNTIYHNRAIGGPLPWDSIILTGGGAGLLLNHLRPILQHDRVLLADNAEDIHLANMRGGRKLYRALESVL